MKVHGFRLWDSARCPQCGTFPDEWLDDRGRVLVDPPFEATVVACQGCRDLDEARQQLDQSDAGLSVRLRSPLHPDADGVSAAD